VGTSTYFSNQLRSSALSEIGNWYAVQTMSRHERLVAFQLDSQGVTTFLPTLTEVHHWSDRRKKVEVPLFPGYLFVHASLSPQVRRTVSYARGVAGFITMGGDPVPVPNEQIESVQKLLANDIPCEQHPFLKVGQRVRIRGGALEGVQGTLLAHNGHKGLVVSIDGIQRSLAICIEGYDVEAL
jgi:transcription antitermination factor NusG